MAQTQSSSRRSGGTSTRFGGGRTPAQSSSGRFGRSSTPQTRGSSGRNVSLRNAQGRKSTSSSSGGRSLGLVNRGTKSTKGRKGSTSGGLMSTLTKALPTGGTATAAKKGGGKPAGFALAAAAAGVAFRNRGKITSMMGRKNANGSSDLQPHSATQGVSDPVVPGQSQPTPPAV